MEMITYGSEAEGLMETKPDITDAQAVQKLLDAYNQNLKVIKMMSEVIDDFTGTLHPRILERMHSFNYYPPEAQYDRWLESEGAEVLLDALVGNEAHLASICNDLHQRRVEDAMDVAEEY